MLDLDAGGREVDGHGVDAEAVAVMFIALTDGLWLEQGIDTTMMSRDAARDACYRFLETHLGSLERPGPLPQPKP